MALIYRCVLKPQDPNFVRQAPTLFQDWLRWKLEDAVLTLPEGDRLTHQSGAEISAVSAGDPGLCVFQGRLYEHRDSDQVRTTFTAVEWSDGASTWIDLDRWSSDVFAPSWVPIAPAIVRGALDHCKCSRGGLELSTDYEYSEGDQGAAVADLVVSPDRALPVVVATPSRVELEGDLDPAHARARELNRRLLGVAKVVLLGPGAVTQFSKRLFSLVGPDRDVHSGSVRVYLPGVGGPADWPRRHRVAPFHRLEGRSADAGARLLSLPLLRASCHEPPPAVWRESLQQLLAGDGGTSAEVLEELLEIAERERDDHARRAAQAENALANEQETVNDLLAAQDARERRLAFLEKQFRDLGQAVPVEEEPEEPFEPDFCSEVIDKAASDLDFVVIGNDVAGAAEELDVHMEPSWARKGWTALQALEAYAREKAVNGFEGNFLTYCTRGQGRVVSRNWVALSESETTDANPKFRDLRTFPISPEVAAEGRAYMPCHIKIQEGGQPNARIHFHDDTGGETGKVHIGWFGAHRDNRSTN